MEVSGSESRLSDSKAPSGIFFFLFFLVLFYLLKLIFFLQGNFLLLLLMKHSSQAKVKNAVRAFPGPSG